MIFQVTPYGLQHGGQRIELALHRALKARDDRHQGGLEINDISSEQLARLIDLQLKQFAMLADSGHDRLTGRIDLGIEGAKPIEHRGVERPQPGLHFLRKHLDGTRIFIDRQFDIGQPFFEQFIERIETLLERGRQVVDGRNQVGVVVDVGLVAVVYGGFERLGAGDDAARKEEGQQTSELFHRFEVL